MRAEIHGQLQIPPGMKSKLEAYQKSVRRVKLAEGILAAAFGLLLSYIFVFALDRVMDTPGWLRGAILVSGTLGLGLFFPLKCHKWVWGTRRMEQVARLLRHKFPRTSDQLLGIVELARGESEQAHSRVLVEAAMSQVDESIKDRDFTDAVPNPRHRRWAWAAAIPAALVIGAIVVVPAAGSNAFVRWLMPWKNTERYTFAKVDALPDTLVVPLAEPFEVSTSLRDDTEWSPKSASASYRNQRLISANLSERGYTFAVPPQKEAGSLSISIGDIRESIAVRPLARPELQGLKAIYTLPKYLQYSHDIVADVRGGSVSLLAGSQAHFEARVSRELQEATVDGQTQKISEVASSVMLEDYSAAPTLPTEVFERADGKLRTVVKLIEWHKKADDLVSETDNICTVVIDGKETIVKAGVAGRIKSLDVQAGESVAREQRIMMLHSKVEISKWTKNVGDKVRPNDTICEVVVTDPETGVQKTIEQKAGDFGIIQSLDLQAGQTTFGPAKLATLIGERIVTVPGAVAESVARDLAWKDKHGLTPRDPFVLKINALEDSAPIIGCELLDQQRVILEGDTIRFDLNISDDFGVRKVGLEWEGVQDPLRNPNPAKGERVVSSGAPEMRNVDTVATFCAKTEELPPQSFKLRAFAEDYLPERERAYSAVYTVHVLSADEHFAWIVEQESRWRRSLEGVYEHELQLHDQNRQLRQLSPEELDEEKNRRKIAQQAAAERANGARLAALTTNGKRLLEEAARNEQFQVGHLETIAQQIQKLENMAKNRMPSVSDMLKAAAAAEAKPGESKNEKTPPSAGENKGNQSGKPGEASDKEGPKNKAPSVSDVESGMNKQNENGGVDAPKPPSKGKFGLPTTTLQGGPPQEPEECPPQEDLDEAVEEQADILAEFEEVREALDEVMGELENSTFVKRFKAASRRQLEMAGDLNRTLIKSFGEEEAKLDDRQKDRSKQLAEREVAQSENVYMIQEDLEAYFNRKQETKFKEVLDDMSDSRVVTKLRGLGDRINENLKGESIVRAEYWADTLDRWAEELVQPAPGGA